MAALRDAGLPEARTEPVALPSRWLPGREEAACLSPAPFPVRLAQVPLAPPTAGRLEVPLVAGDAGMAPPPGSAGSAVLFRREATRPGEPPGRNEGLRALAEAAARAGAAAVLVESTRAFTARERLHPGGTAPLPLPAAVVTRPDAGRLARLAARGATTVSLRFEGKDHGPGESANVVGELPGRDPAGGLVLLATHLDSWDLGTGALDSGVNVATLLAVARGLAAHGARPRATIRFVFFTGEEEDRLGSRAYVATHAGELSRHAVALVLDLGSGPFVGFLVNGRRELEGPLLSFLSRFAPRRGFPMTRRPYLGSDDGPLVAAGVPTAVVDQARIDGTGAVHTEDDVVDRVDVAAAHGNARFLAALAWELAERPPGRAGESR